MKKVIKGSLKINDPISGQVVQYFDSIEMEVKIDEDVQINHHCGNCQDKQYNSPLKDGDININIENVEIDMKDFCELIAQTLLSKALKGDN